MPDQETPRVVRALRDLERKAKEMASAQRDPASEVKRLRDLIRAIVSRGPYVFDPRDVEVQDGKSLAIGRCFWCDSRVEGAESEANHATCCAWPALATEAED